MGCTCSSLKVCGHLEVVGQCGGVDRLTLCLPRRGGKGGRRRLLGTFIFPSAGGGPGQHRSVRRVLVPIGRVAKKDGATPVRVDFLAGESLVARREIPLADLLAGLQANTLGSRSSLFFSLKAEGATVSAYYSRRLLEEEPTSGRQHASLRPQAGEANTSLPPQAGEMKISLPPYAVSTKTSETPAILVPEVTYRDLTPKVTVIDLVDGQEWTLPRAQPWREWKPTLQVGRSMTNLSPEVVHRDLGDGQRWAGPQVQPWQRRVNAPQAGENLTSLTPEVIHRDLGDGEGWAAPQAQLRHRRARPLRRSSLGGGEGVVQQPSLSSPSQRCGKGGGSWGGLCGPCLVDGLLQCAQVMSFTLLMYLVYLDWF